MVASVLLIIDENDATKNRASLVSAARLLGQVSLFVVGQRVDVELMKNLDGIESICWLDSVDQHFSTEDLFYTLMPYITDADYIVSSTEITGRNLLPKLAGKFQQLIVTNVIDIAIKDDHRLLNRPAFMGSIVETIQLPKSVRCFITIQAARFPAAKQGDHPVTIASADLLLSPHRIQIDPMLSDKHKVSLTDADIVVGCGLGTKNIINMDDLVHNLNNISTTATGVTRALVDHQQGSLDTLVGQTGKSVSPHIYLALGISGASQHICGVMNAKKVIAINKDPEAAIFQIADYGLIGDLRDIMPELIHHLSINHDNL